LYFHEDKRCRFLLNVTKSPVMERIQVTETFVCNFNTTRLSDRTN
jgi:hypothetical protein